MNLLQSFQLLSDKTVRSFQAAWFCKNTLLRSHEAKNPQSNRNKHLNSGRNTLNSCNENTIPPSHPWWSKCKIFCLYNQKTLIPGLVIGISKEERIRRCTFLQENWQQIQRQNSLVRTDLPTDCRKCLSIFHSRALCQISSMFIRGKQFQQDLQSNSVSGCLLYALSKLTHYRWDL